jgi:protein-S-isoprenylcysteine O-methyltransferase Ste14
MRLPSNNPMLDLIGRAVLIAIFGMLATAKVIAISIALRAPVVDFLEVATHAANLAFLSLVVFLVVFRLRPVRGSEGWEPRIAALLGSTLPLLLLFLSPGPREVRVAGLVLIAVGWVLSVYVVAYLGRSFSVMPQARRLVTDGPYRWVRHPLYVAEQVAVIGVMLLYLSIPAVAIVVVHWLIQLRRMTHEERVLRNSFPEYEAYALATPRVIPRLV